MRLDVAWVTAFLDLPEPVWERGVEFWRAVTGSGLSAPRGEHDEFATLLPSDGEPFLRVQRIASGRPGIHLDLHSPGAAFVPSQSPGGLPWCRVSGTTGPRPGPVDWGTHTSLVDQVSIDIPPDTYDEECAFWAETTGWAPAPTSAPYMRQLVRADGMPFRILLQRRDEGDPPVTAHLDLATTDRDAEVARHLALGAEVDGGGARWTRMRDPAGMLYCITDRDPATGLLPG